MVEECSKSRGQSLTGKCSLQVTIRGPNLLEEYFSVSVFSVGANLVKQNGMKLAKNTLMKLL